MANYAWRSLGNYLVCAHTAEPPSREEWDGVVAAIAGMDHEGTLVHTEGGSPSATQRKQLRDALTRGREPAPSAVLTDSVVARSAITALNLFLGGKIKALAPHEIDEGLRYIKAPQEQWPLFKQTLEDLKRELGIKPSGRGM